MQSPSLQELADNFALFTDWEERYRYLIDLGKNLSPISENLKSDQNLVRGCTSRVWLAAEIQDGKLHFQADSDAQIVRGLIVLLMAAYQDRCVTDIPGVDILGTFNEIGLDQNLSPNRRNGFYAMVEKIRSYAA